MLLFMYLCHHALRCYRWLSPGSTPWSTIMLRHDSKVGKVNWK